MRVTGTVAVALLALTAGCGALGGAPTGTPADTSSASGPRSPAACSTDLLLTDDGNDRVTPKPLPDGPPTLSAEAAGQFARAYERAFAHNHELGDRARDVTVELQGTTVRSAEDGYRVRIHVWTRTTVGTAAGVTPGGPNATTRESYDDAHYFVSASTLRRAETERHGSLPDADLSRSGATLACWE